MKSSLVPFFLIASTLLAVTAWQPALPGYRYSFPRDHFSHPAYKTEWWYYTGNLHTKEGRRFGFELTFFRAGTDPQAEATPVWRTDDVWLAHLALSDIKGRRFLHTQRMNRTGPGFAGASLRDVRYWNGNWQVRWLDPKGNQELQAVTENFSLRLRLNPAKPPIVNGREGVSQKGPKPGEASHYISFSRLNAIGELQYNGQRFSVDGLTWMDHEFFTEQNDTDLAGWDWFAIQLSDNQELMLYRLRLKSGGTSPFSSGTYVDAAGNAHWLASTDFTLLPGREWRSPDSGAMYPIAWTIRVPGLHLELNQTTPLEAQELFAPYSPTPTYWEGAVDYAGHMRDQPIRGVGYLEMTGYGQTRPVF